MIVPRQCHDDAIADDEPDEITLRTARRMGDDDSAAVDLDAVQRAREQLHDHARQLTSRAAATFAVEL